MIRVYFFIGVMLGALIAITAEAKPLFDQNDTSYRLFKVEEFSIEHLNYQANRDPYFPEHSQTDWQFMDNFNFKISILGSFYWQNRFHMSMDKPDHQIKSAGWEHTMGLEVFKWLDLVKYHHSRHVLEESRPYRFPVTDAWGFKINLIK
jgi:hypothetical protein